MLTLLDTNGSLVIIIIIKAEMAVFNVAGNFK